MLTELCSHSKANVSNNEIAF